MKEGEEQGSEQSGEGEAEEEGTESDLVGPDVTQANSAAILSQQLSAPPPTYCHF